jgi:hypothetical protein
MELPGTPHKVNNVPLSHLRSPVARMRMSMTEFTPPGSGMPESIELALPLPTVHEEKEEPHPKPHRRPRGRADGTYRCRCKKLVRDRSSAINSHAKRCKAKWTPVLIKCPVGMCRRVSVTVEVMRAHVVSRHPKEANAEIYAPPEQ